MKKHFADFNSYALEDFIDDPGFILWITAPTKELDAFWQQVTIDYPQTLPVITDAKRIVLSMRFQADQMGIAEQQSLWKNIETAARLRQSPALRIPLWFRSVAAVFLLGLLSLSVFLYIQQRDVEVSTTFGQMKTLTLSDGSVVTLNANSKLHYPAKWNTDHIREVWIEGEAFFKVNHLHKSGMIKPSDRFIVHAEKLNVEVLGTSFNVNNRRGQVRVALVTGRVGINVKGSASPQVRLLPGDLAEYLGNRQPIVKKRVSAIDYVLWKSGKMRFDNTSLSEILQLIEDNYGYKVILKDPSIGRRRLSGTFVFSTEDTFFKALSASLGITIEKDQSTHQLIIK